jgi:hypothetical protein
MLIIKKNIDNIVMKQNNMKNLQVQMRGLVVDDEHVYQHFVLVFRFLLNPFNIVHRTFDMIFDIQALPHNIKIFFFVFCFILHHIDELLPKKIFFRFLVYISYSLLSIYIILSDLCCVEIHSFFFYSSDDSEN